MSTSRISWRPSFAALLAYAVAILSVTTALVTGLLLDQFLQTMPYVSLFLCSIMFAAWFGGFGPSLLATGIAILLFTYYFVDPGGSFEVAAKDVPRVALFTVTALFVVSLSAAQRRTADSLRFARDELQATVGELARVNRALEAENAQRRRVEAYLDEAQELSRTGSFSWKVSSGDAFWSKEGYRILGLDQAAKPSIDLLLQRVHQDDQRIVQHEIDRVRQGEQDYDYELRWLMPNGPTKHLRVRAHRVRFDVGEDEIVGALIDVSEAREAQESPACGTDGARPCRACGHARGDECLDRPRGEPAAGRASSPTARPACAGSTARSRSSARSAARWSALSATANVQARWSNGCARSPERRLSRRRFST